MVLVAGYGFGGGFFGLGGFVPVAIGRGDANGFPGVGEVCRNGLGDVRNRADLHYRRLGLLQHELFVDGANTGLLLKSHLAADAVLFGSGQRNVVLQVANARSVIGIDNERVFIGSEIDVLALGVDLVLPVILVPLGDGRVLVHVFDDVAPAHAGVVRAEADFALLRAVGDDAHFGAAEVVVEKILEPHAGDEEEVPGILAALHGVVKLTIRRGLAVFLFGILGERPSLVELLEKVVQRQALGSLERMVILQESQSHHEVGEGFAAGSVGDRGNVLHELP